MADFLAALRERVLVFDGAFGTWVQAADLDRRRLRWARPSRGATRTSAHPARRHRRLAPQFFEVGVDAVETATFGAFPIVLAEYDIPREDLRDERGRRPRIAREVAASVLDPRPAPLRDRVHGPGHQAPVARPHRLRRRCATPTCRRWRGCSTAASTSCSIETVQDLLQGKAAIVAARARDGGHRRRGPADGPGDGRDDRPHAHRLGDRRRARRRSRRCGPTSSG